MPCSLPKTGPTASQPCSAAHSHQPSALMLRKLMPERVKISFPATSIFWPSFHSLELDKLNFLSSDSPSNTGLQTLTITLAHSSSLCHSLPPPLLTKHRTDPLPCPLPHTHRTVSQPQSPPRLDFFDLQCTCSLRSGFLLSSHCISLAPNSTSVFVSTSAFVNCASGLPSWAN